MDAPVIDNGTCRTESSTRIDVPANCTTCGNKNIKGNTLIVECGPHGVRTILFPADRIADARLRDKLWNPAEFYALIERAMLGDKPRKI